MQCIISSYVVDDGDQRGLAALCRKKAPCGSLALAAILLSSNKKQISVDFINADLYILWKYHVLQLYQATDSCWQDDWQLVVVKRVKGQNADR